MPSKLERVIAELSELIQDEGLTDERVAKFAPTIKKIMNVGDQRVVMEILEITRAMGQGKYVQALRNAFGMAIPGPPVTLTERRQQFLELGYFPNINSEATLRRWEKAAMEQLAQRILDRGDVQKRDMPLDSVAASLMLRATEVKHAHDEALDKARHAQRLANSQSLDATSKRAALDALISARADQAKLAEYLDAAIEFLGSDTKVVWRSESGSRLPSNSNE